MAFNVKPARVVDHSLHTLLGLGSPGGLLAPGSRLVRRLLVLLILAVVSGLVLVNVFVHPFPGRAPVVEPVWGSKPVLGYFVMTASLSNLLQEQLELTEGQNQAIHEITLAEVEQIRALEVESFLILQNSQLDLSEKRAKIEEMGYNEQILGVINASQRSLERALGPVTYAGLEDWIENRWVVERSLHGSPIRSPGARTFRIFATRYDSGGSYTVALPDQCVKFANAGNHVCDEDGYQVGQNYTVYLSYKGATAATVLESGPWNINDNYWATLNDPTPRRMFADLPLGMPEAQAAYFDNYNGGVDQFGRVVTAPYGIDLARQVSIDIGLQPGTNDWIDVTFLWTEGWNGAGAPPPPDSDTTLTPAPTVEVIIPVEVATPQPDGSIIHVVQQGQALLHIAKAYGVELPELLKLNGLDLSAVIFPGDELIIKLAEATPTPTEIEVTSSATKTVKPSATPRPSRTPVVKTHTPEAEALAESRPGVDPLLVIIAVLIVTGAALVLFGSYVKRSS